MGKKIQVAIYVLKKYTKRIEISRVEVAGEVGRRSWMQEDGQRGCGPNAIRELTMYLPQRRAFQGEETARFRGRNEFSVFQKQCGDHCGWSRSGPASEEDWKGAAGGQSWWDLQQRAGVRV